MEGKTLFSLGLVLLFVSLVAATSDTSQITSALSQLCDLFYKILPIAILLVVVLAGVVFAAGQAMGAETRARANVWATNLLIGAIIAGVVIVLAPWFLQLVTGFSLNQACSSSSSGGGSSGGGHGGGVVIQW